jgi:hypothetical protein
MNIENYIGVCQKRLDQLTANRAIFAERALNMRSNWGGDITKSWIAELDRRIAEQSAILAGLKRKRARH